jgi:hypothetical protein
MAHARTTAGQVIAQLSIGAGIAAIYHAAFLKKSAPSPRADLLAELDQETTRVTSGDVWGLKDAQGAGEKRRSLQQDSNCAE